MIRHWFKIISPILLLFTVHAVTAMKGDSLQNLLESRLKTEKFEHEKAVVEYLDLTSKLYPVSPTDALFYVIALEEKLESEKNKTAKAYILSKKGSFYWLQGVYDASLKAFFESLKLFEQEENKVEVIKTLNNIGETYKKQKDYPQSARFIQLALANATELDDFSSELILVNLGQLFMLQGNFDSANYYLNQIQRRDSASAQSRGFMSLYKGIVKRESGQIDSAQYFLQKSLIYWDELNYGRGTIESKIEIAKINISQNNFSEANENLLEAENIAFKTNALDLLLKIYQSKIDLFKSRGSKDSLIFYFDKYLEVKDSIFNSESRAEINELSIQYNMAQKEKESYKLALEQSQLANKIEKRTQFVIFLIVVLIFAIVLIFYLRNKSNQLKSAHIKLKQQKEEIEEKQKNISSKSLALARLNKELHNLNNNLEQRVLERTEKLNKRNNQIAKFTYYNSHKLRAPVANVLGLINVIELTKTGVIDPVVLKHLKSSAMELDNVIFHLKNLLETDEETEE